MTFFKVINIISFFQNVCFYLLCSAFFNKGIYDGAKIHIILIFTYPGKKIQKATTPRYLDSRNPDLICGSLISLRESNQVTE